MYSHDETIEAVLAFYKQLVKLTYPDESLLKIPPKTGWDSIDIETKGVRGKNDTVQQLLRNLPYLSAGEWSTRLLIAWETEPICYTPNNAGYSDTGYMEELNPLPSDCVYLTKSVDREGYNLILDTSRGTITEYSIIGYRIQVPYEDFEDIPDKDKWKAHRTTPVVQFFAHWTRLYAKLVWMLTPNIYRGPTSGLFHSRAQCLLEEEELVSEETEREWHPEVEMGELSSENESAHENANTEARSRALLHTANVYNMHLRHGWPANFDKEKCRMELMKIQKRKDAEDRRELEKINPDAGLF